MSIFIDVWETVNDIKMRFAPNDILRKVNSEHWSVFPVSDLEIGKTAQIHQFGTLQLVIFQKIALGNCGLVVYNVIAYVCGVWTVICYISWF